MAGILASTALAETTWLLAHEGGWDEALWVLIPAALVALILRNARSRAESSRTPPEEIVSDEAGPSGAGDVDPDAG